MLRSVFKSAFLATGIAICSAAGAQAQTAQQFAYSPPPALTFPINQQAAPVPVIFQWTGVSGVGNPYGIIIQGRGRRSSVPLSTLPTVNYELQISDLPEVGTRVLFDVITSAPRYVFFNRNVPNSGFTSQQPPGLALTAGRYYWRVRAISAGPAAPFSEIQSFGLQTNGTGTQIRDLAVDEVRLATEQPRADNGTVIFAKIVNAGTFASQPTAVHVSVNGTTIAEGTVQQLNPNETVSVAVPWTPVSSGYASVQIRLDTVDDKSSDNSRTLQTFVLKRQVYRTGMAGTLQNRNGRFVLLDGKQRAIAVITLAPGEHIDLASFVGRSVTITGRLYASSTGFTLQAERVGAAQP